MRKFLKHIGIVGIVTLVTVSLISYGSLQLLKRSSFYKPSFLVNAVDDQSFDYIVLGSSTGLTTLNTKVIDSILGTSGINLSMDDTGLASQYIMLQHFLKQGKTTQYCILSPSASSFDVNYTDVSDNDYRFLPFVDQAYVQDYYKKYDSRRANILSTSRWLPVAGVSYYNAEILFPAAYSAFKRNKRNRFDDRGNYTYPDLEADAHPIASKSRLKIHYRNSDLEAIRELCESNGITLVYYFSPMREKEIVSQPKNIMVINHSSLLENTMYFYDAIHVNNLGRQKTSTQFAFDFQTRFE